ncbi:MAG: hypothetical protein BMS9Abin05_1334 [Rhodothermia bacterium]|nr:MAG: hypothetical protein BMS9Abin05_1334 [Rhodothermia bacterium]
MNVDTPTLTGTMRSVSLILTAIMFSTLTTGCDSAEDLRDSPSLLFNLSHLDRLGETISLGDSTLRIIHIYSEAPDYAWVADDDEGAAALDDAARAAVVYLRHFELTGDRDSLEKAKQLLRFIMYMQREDGLFYNFVWDSSLRINTDHPNSRAEPFGWWAARGIWALGTGARVLMDEDPSFSELSAERIRRAYPHLRILLTKYQQYGFPGGRAVPLWLISETASDATSELLLGLTSLYRAYPDEELREMVDRFADGIATMQYGSMNVFPYGSHASFTGIWHGWGNSQTMALSEAGRTASAVYEAENFYPRLLTEGWLNSISFNDPDASREFDQIAYAVRAVAVGLLRLSEATSETKYAIMAGLAASWFLGNNVASFAMYDAKTGRGYDGIGEDRSVNRNSGAESTIEALFTILEIEYNREARMWIGARNGEGGRIAREGKEYTYRVFTMGADEGVHRLGLVLDLTNEQLMILEAGDLDRFLAD